MNEDLDGIELGESIEVENIQKNILTKEEKLTYLEKESPELINLLAEFKDKMVEIKEVLDPILQKVKKNEISTSKGISFLEVKHQLLLSYCINISFYLMLKAEGKSVKNHPVIDQLVKSRTILEKMRPIESRLKHQIEKLVRISKTDGSEVLHQPNLKNLELDATAEDQKYDELEIYKPPKIQAIEQNDAKKAKQEKLKLRERKRAKESKIAKFIEEEYGDKPEETGEGLRSSLYGEDPRDAELREFEEANMARYGTKKQDRKKLQKKLNAHNNMLEELGDFGDMVGLEDEEDVARREAEEYLKEKRIARYMETVDNKRKSRDDSENEIASDSDVDPEPKPKKSRPARTSNIVDGPIPTMEARLPEGAKRSINNKIEKNRGLTRSRKKEIKTPHTHNRAKYAVALQKHKSRVTQMRSSTAPYSGETRINKKVVKGRNLDYQSKTN